LKIYDRRVALMDLAKLHGYIVEKNQHDSDPVGMLADIIRGMQRSALPIGVQRHQLQPPPIQSGAGSGPAIRPSRASAQGEPA